jgi:hypothetical protein
MNRSAHFQTCAASDTNHRTIAANRMFRNLTKLGAAIREYFADFTPARAPALANYSVVR